MKTCRGPKLHYFDYASPTTLPAYAQRKCAQKPLLIADFRVCVSGLSCAERTEPYLCAGVNLSLCVDISAECIFKSLNGWIRVYSSVCVCVCLCM